MICQLTIQCVFHMSTFNSQFGRDQGPCCRPQANIIEIGTYLKLTPPRIEMKNWEIKSNKTIIK